MTAEQFFSSSRGQKSLSARFGEALAQLLQTQPEDVQVFSVAEAGSQTEAGKVLSVWFAVRGSPYHKTEKLQGYVAAGRAKVSPPAPGPAGLAPANGG